jgi:ankyrin repeat protein
MQTGIRNGEPARVREALENGACVNMRLGNDYTPVLSISIESMVIGANWSEQYERIVRTLLEFGVNIEAADRMGITPLMVAAKTGAVEALGWLLDAGANPERCDKLGKGALFHANSSTKVSAVLDMVRERLSARLTQIALERKTECVPRSKPMGGRL